MKFQQLLGRVRKACEMYDLIDENDKIAVGLSGGKDSIMLLTTLARLKKFYPKKFDLIAISIDLFNGETDYSELIEYCKNLGVELTVVKSNIKKIVFDVRKESNPCSLCANLRRGILNNTAQKMNCNKVALGHHADDLIETLLLSTFYESRLNTFMPKTHLTNKDIIVIRPMVLIEEKDIISVGKNLPILNNPCPANKHTKREYMKDLIKNISKDIPGLKEHILSAIIHPERYNLFPITNEINTNDNKSQNIAKKH